MNTYIVYLRDHSTDYKTIEAGRVQGKEAAIALAKELVGTVVSSNTDYFHVTFHGDKAGFPAVAYFPNGPVIE